MKNVTILGVGVLSLSVGYKILMGEVPSHYFAGPENELGCCVIALTMGVLSFVALDWKGLGKWLVSERS